MEAEKTSRTSELERHETMKRIFATPIVLAAVALLAANPAEKGNPPPHGPAATVGSSQDQDLREVDRNIPPGGGMVGYPRPLTILALHRFLLKTGLGAQDVGCRVVERTTLRLRPDDALV